MTRKPWEPVKRHTAFSEDTVYQGLLEAQKREGQVSRIGKHDPVETWMEDANCVGCDPERFFPYIDHSGVARDMRQEKKVCANCGVRPECANYALKINANAGLWAGVLIGSNNRLWREHLKIIASGREP